MSNDSQGGIRLVHDANRHTITSRLLILQSKRLMLNSVHRRLISLPSEPQVLALLDYFRAETQRAQHAYHSTVLKFGSPEDSDFWVIAYSRLVTRGGNLIAKLQRAAPSLPPAAQAEVANDVVALEKIVEGWTESMRRSMVRAVA
ncbi:MAG TPA: hypothetical protein VNA65_02525 [Candidatus Dormibacteraeota bacterium]|nr:hypothetical protein [Candidatus Dormibacteraeota bacterium]